MFKWWREWRAWVDAEKRRREEALVDYALELIHGEEWNQYSKRRIVSSIIARVRKHDTEGVQ